MRHEKRFSIIPQAIISIHAPRAGCDEHYAQKPACAANFNPRTPCGVRHRRREEACRYGRISIHAPRAGCDLSQPSSCQPNSDFNPRTPCGVRRRKPGRVGDANGISIHAPRAGCDFYRRCKATGRKISIHAPRAGCDVVGCVIAERLLIFQSTHPVRGATEVGTWQSKTIRHFNPRTPCGVRQTRFAKPAIRLVFQSTHPVRGATRGQIQIRGNRMISIHAPRAGCDYPQ